MTSEPILMSSPAWVQRAEQRAERILARVGNIPEIPAEDDPDVPNSRAWHQARFAAHEQAHVDPLFADATSDLPVVREWVSQYLASPRGACTLLMAGPNGAGKTHAAWAALRMIGRSGGPFVGWRAISTVDWFPAMRPPAPDPAAVFRRYAAAELLFMDDLGADKPSEWAEAELFRLVDYRYRNKLPSIFTSNYGPRLLSKQVGDRVLGRLAEMTGPGQRFHYTPDEHDLIDWRRRPAS